MPLFYFDFREGDDDGGLELDQDGIDFPSIEAYHAAIDIWAEARHKGRDLSRCWFVIRDAAGNTRSGTADRRSSRAQGLITATAIAHSRPVVRFPSRPTSWGGRRFASGINREAMAASDRHFGGGRNNSLATCPSRRLDPQSLVRKWNAEPLSYS